MKKENLSETLKRNPYPGRGIVIGESGDGSTPYALRRCLEENLPGGVLYLRGNGHAHYTQGSRRRAYRGGEDYRPPPVLWIQDKGGTEILTVGFTTDVIVLLKTSSTAQVYVVSYTFRPKLQV